MAIKKVRVRVNNVWTELTYNSGTGKYEGNITAPGTTSFHMDGGYYPMEVEATNDAGTVTVVNDADATVGQKLRLMVKEKIKPVIVLKTPTNGAYLQNNKQTVIFTVTDEAGGSGVKESTIKLTIDGTVYGTDSFIRETITNGCQYTYTPSSALSDGEHTITISAQDNDGNSAAVINAKVIIDTVPPTLNVTSPGDTITNNSVCTVAGVTNDATSSPVTVTIKLNSGTEQAVTVQSDGRFSKAITLTEGNNSIVVKATDAAGKMTTVTKTVQLDTTVPKVIGVTLQQNPVSASSSVTISIEVQ